MDSVTLPPPGPIPMPNSPSPAEITSLQSLLSLYYAFQSIIYTFTITPFIWSIRTSYSLTSYIFSPFLIIFRYLFSWITWPFAILRDVFNVFEPLAIFFCNALVIGLIAGTAIAIISASLTFFLGFIIPQHPPNHIPESDLPKQQPQQSSPKIKKEFCTANSNSNTDTDGASSFDSDDDPWTTSSAARRGARQRPSVTKILPAPGKKKQPKVIVGLLNETIHEEVSDDSDGSESSSVF
ncbi:hypothetical protein QBC44DRAFT_314857 [Cladorrhinum sp. PSN332]|nr:hypothetical protein QBC44DRAFT_314857 [Cladorrhinum sp. PSN332]